MCEGWSEIPVHFYTFQNDNSSSVSIPALSPQGGIYTAIVVPMISMLPHTKKKKCLVCKSFLFTLYGTIMLNIFTNYLGHSTVHYSLHSLNKIQSCSLVFRPHSVRSHISYANLAYSLHYGSISETLKYYISLDL